MCLSYGWTASMRPQACSRIIDALRGNKLGSRGMISPRYRARLPGEPSTRVCGCMRKEGQEREQQGRAGAEASEGADCRRDGSCGCHGSISGQGIPWQGRACHGKHQSRALPMRCLMQLHSPIAAAAAAEAPMAVQAGQRWLGLGRCARGCTALRPGASQLCMPCVLAKQHRAGARGGRQVCRGGLHLDERYDCKGSQQQEGEQGVTLQSSKASEGIGTRHGRQRCVTACCQ